MDPRIAIMVVAVTLIGSITWLINNCLRIKHGIPTDEELAVMAVRGDRDSDGRVRALTDENDALRGQVARLEERMAVLERIATDPAERTAREIENLRQS
jgi:hypothetical protein